VTGATRATARLRRAGSALVLAPVLALVQVVLVLALLAATAGAVEPQQPATPDSPAGRALQAQPLGADPATAGSWLSAWRQVFPGDLMGYRALRRGFVDLYLRQAAGEPLPADATLASLRQLGATLPPLPQDRDAQARWARALALGLVPLRAGAEPVPGEIESLAERLQPLAPGLWLARHRDGRVSQLFWAQRVSVRGAVPLAPQALQARFAAPGGAALAFDCPPERGQRSAVLPGEHWQLLCRARGAVDERSPALQALVAQLARDGVAAASWTSDDFFSSEGALETLLHALTARVPDRTAMYATAHLGCESRGRCEAEARAAAPGARIRADGPHAGAHPRTPPPEPPLVQTPTARDLAKGLALAVAAFIVFCIVARTAGTRLAAGLMLVLLLPLAWRFGSGWGAASVLLAGGALAAALLATGVFLLGYWLYDALVFSRYAPPAALREGGRRPGDRASA
jgi:hypothetical protein